MVAIQTQILCKHEKTGLKPRKTHSYVCHLHVDNTLLLSISLSPSADLLKRGTNALGFLEPSNTNLTIHWASMSCIYIFFFPEVTMQLKTINDKIFREQGLHLWKTEVQNHFICIVLKLYITKTRLKISSRFMAALSSFLNKAEQTMEGKTGKITRKVK